MSTEEEKRTETPDAPGEGAGASGGTLSREGGPLALTDGSTETAEEEHDDDESAEQLGYRRYVYAAYFAGAIAVAFVAEKTLSFAWMSLAKWKPNVGEPQDELVMPIAAVTGVAVAVYYWRRTRARELAEDVASELAKVTWPTRKEVVNNTFVVVVTTTFATVFFTLMDRFWSFVTNWVYGT